VTSCAANRYGDHDYSQPPHNTPDDPRSAEDDGPCQAQSAAMPPWCQHERRYELVIYQPGTHDWIRLFACVPCTATLRMRHQRLGPGGSDGIATVRDADAMDRVPEGLTPSRINLSAAEVERFRRRLAEAVGRT
jgi:hypothetical protein